MTIDDNNASPTPCPKRQSPLQFNLKLLGRFLLGKEIRNLHALRGILLNLLLCVVLFHTLALTWKTWCIPTLEIVIEVDIEIDVRRTPWNSRTCHLACWNWNHLSPVHSPIRPGPTISVQPQLELDDDDSDSHVAQGGHPLECPVDGNA